MEVSGQLHTSVVLSPRKNSRYTLGRKVVGPRSCSGRRWKEGQPVALTEGKPWSVSLRYLGINIFDRKTCPDGSALVSDVCVGSCRSES